jgi:hypothetical protein
MMSLHSKMHNKYYLGMSGDEGMNESSMRCFDNSLIKKQGRTYSTDRSSLARYGDISWKLKDLLHPPIQEGLL